MARQERSFRTLGMGTTGLVVTVAVLGLAGFGGWYAWCYYKVLDRENAMDKALEGVGRFRDGKPTGLRIQQKALERIRAGGGQGDAGDVTVHLAPLTLANAAQLSEVWQQKLRVACKTQGAVSAHDARLDRIRRAAEEAPVLGRGTGRPPRADPPAARPSSRGCTRELLEEMGWTFVRVEAKALVKVGLVKRRVSLKHVFFLMQKVPSGAPEARKAAGDEDDE